VSSTRLDVSPGSARGAIVEPTSDVWPRPRRWPTSCVTVFCTSVATQVTSYMLAGHGGASTVVNRKRGVLSSMSESRMRPDDGWKDVVVMAMAPGACCQQSYLLPQLSSLRHWSPAGTTSAHMRWRNSTTFSFEALVSS
jgi:hypothetical protein